MSEDEFRLGFMLDVEHTEKLLYICRELEDEPIDLIKRSISTMKKRLEATHGE